MPPAKRQAEISIFSTKGDEEEFYLLLQVHGKTMKMPSRSFES